MKKDSNIIGMTRKEFENYKKNAKYIEYPYEYYRVFPILNHQHQKDLIVFMRTNNNPVDIIKECARLLEEENK